MRSGLSQADAPQPARLCTNSLVTNSLSLLKYLSCAARPAASSVPCPWHNCSIRRVIFRRQIRPGLGLFRLLGPRYQGIQDLADWRRFLSARDMFFNYNWTIAIAD